MKFKFTDGYSNYAKFPMHYLRITQNYKEGNHKLHWYNANYKDYPIDLGGIDGGRDYLYAPVDMKIVALRGIGNKLVSNKIFLQSVNAVKTPSYGITKIFMTVVHFNDSDVSKYNLKVGKIIKAGNIICSEGKETATANHLHLTCGIGNSTQSIKNNNGKWVTKGNCKKPEEIFYIDKNFTVIKNTAGLKFINLPKIDKIKTIGVPVLRNTNKNQIDILVDNLRVRDNANTTAPILGYAKKGLYDYTETKTDNNYTWYNIGVGWIAYDINWCKIYEKEEVDDKIIDNSNDKNVTLPDSKVDSPVEPVAKDIVEPKVEEVVNTNKKTGFINFNTILSIINKIKTFVKKILSIIIKIK